MSILWAARARDSLQAIFEHIAEENPAAAHTLLDRIISSTEQTLTEHPQAGRPGRVAGTREWVVHRSYIVAYRVIQDGQVQVLDVVHAARLWPGLF